MKVWGWVNHDFDNLSLDSVNAGNRHIPPKLINQIFFWSQIWLEKNYLLDTHAESPKITFFRWSLTYMHCACPPDIPTPKGSKCQSLLWSIFKPLDSQEIFVTVQGHIIFRQCNMYPKEVKT